MSEGKDFGRRLRSRLFTICCDTRFRIPAEIIKITARLSWYPWETGRPDWNSRSLSPTWKLSAAVSFKAVTAHKTWKEWQRYSDAFVIPDTCMKQYRSRPRPTFPH